MKTSDRPIIENARFNILGWALSLIFLAYALYCFDWGKIWLTLKQANLRFILFLSIIYIFDFLLRAYRWKLLLYPIKKQVSLPKLFYSYNIAYMANVFLPARAGELVRVLITGEDENISKRTLGGTILLERMLDIIGMGVLILTVFFFFTAKELTTQLLLCLIILAVILLICVTLMALLFITVKYSAYFNQKFPRIGRIITFFRPVYDGFRALNRSKIFLSVIFLSIFMWALNTFIVYLYARTLSLQTTFLNSAVILSCQLVGEFIPSAPSSFGTFHAATIVGAKFTGLTANEGMALGFLNHAYDLILRIIVGLVSIHLSGFDFKKGLKNVYSSSRQPAEF